MSHDQSNTLNIPIVYGNGAYAKLPRAVNGSRAGTGWMCVAFLSFVAALGNECGLLPESWSFGGSHRGLSYLLFAVSSGLGIRCFLAENHSPNLDFPNTVLEDNEETVRLDATGITFPAVLLDRGSRLFLAATTPAAVTIRWTQIDSWTRAQSPSPWILRGAIRSHDNRYDWYVITLKRDVERLGGSRVIRINASPLLQFDADIVAFAQRFLNFHVDPMKVSVSSLKPIALVAGLVTLIFIFGKARLYWH